MTTVNEVSGFDSCKTYLSDKNGMRDSVLALVVRNAGILFEMPK